MVVSTLQFAALYTAANMLILLWLGVGVVRHRLSKKITLGDGGDEGALGAIRAHANAAEWMPLPIIALFALASLSAPAWLIHVVGGLLTAGRIAHPIGMTGGPLVFRQLGMVATWTAFVIAAAGLIWRGLAL